MKETRHLPLVTTGLILCSAICHGADPNPLTVQIFPQTTAVQAGAVANRTFSIRGTWQALNWSASIEPEEAAGWIQVAPASGTVGAYETVQIVLSVAATNKQSSSALVPATLKLHSPGFLDSETSLFIDIRADGLVGSFPPESIGLPSTPQGMIATNSLLLWTGSVPIYNWKMTVTNSSGAPCPWLTITPNAGALLTNTYEKELELLIAADTSSLPVGSYAVTAVFSAQNLSSAQAKNRIIKTITLAVTEPLDAAVIWIPVPDRGTILGQEVPLQFTPEISYKLQSRPTALLQLQLFDQGTNLLASSEAVAVNRSSEYQRMSLSLPIPGQEVRLGTNVTQARIRAVLWDGAALLMEGPFVEYAVAERLRVQLHQKITLPGAFGSATTNDVRAEFTRVLNGSNRVIVGPVLQVTSSNVLLRVPPSLIGPGEALPQRARADEPISISVVASLPDRTVHYDFPNVDLIWPRRLVHDEVFVPPLWPAGAAPQFPTDARTLLQFALEDPKGVNDPETLATFVFSGQAANGMAALRVLNVSMNFPVPLRLDGQVSVFEPDLAVAQFEPVFPFTLLSEPLGSDGVQFNIRRDGLHLIVVEAQTNSPGPYPAPFQVHLAGNVGVARKLINGVAEPPRGTRRDVLFNHVAPQTALLGGDGHAETAVFKFANLVGVSPYPVALLIPSEANGFGFGSRPVRAADPTVPLEVTTPGAPASPVLQPGTVLDVTQIPVPASPVGLGPVAGTVGALFGATNTTFTLPFTADNGLTVASVILDFGSGHELVDGTGNDLAIFTTSGSCQVAAANSPYTNDFRRLGGTLAGLSQFDLATCGLTSARYVLFSALSSVTLTGVRALNQFADEVQPDLGPVVHTRSGNILVRRDKASTNQLDPFVQLMAPDGELRGENESSFGDDTSPDRSDAALLGATFSQDGFHRFLVKGYDQTPDLQAFGTFYARLETDGSYDPVELLLSGNDEEQCPVQKTGIVSRTRQRDSYLFQANPGTRVTISVTGHGNGGLDPMVEVYDPEDFLIAANDNYEGRGLNAALTVTLPSVSVRAVPPPIPSTYRIVVSASDRLGAVRSWSEGQVYLREPPSGQYDLKAFTGSLAISAKAGPVVSSINPASGPAGSTVVLKGTNFSSDTSEISVFFGAIPAVFHDATPTSISAIVPPAAPAGALSITVHVAGRVSPPAEFTVTQAAAVRSAAVRLDCLSVKFEPATAAVDGQAYTLALTSGFDPDMPNGEVYGNHEEGAFTHSSTYVLRGPGGDILDIGGLDLNIPAHVDSDGNGVVDFFEMGKAIPALTTEGLWMNMDGANMVEATWNRSAGSARGTCRLRVLGATPVPLPTFESTFELLEYLGTLEYVSDSAGVSGSMALFQPEAPSNSLTGKIVVTRSDTNRFNTLTLQAGSWTNALTQACAYDPTILRRYPAQPAVYTGQVTFVKSPITFQGGTYLNWRFMISDPNDSNQNGVPDLSDDPQTNALQLVLRAVRFSTDKLDVQISAPIGTHVDLETTTSLKPPLWKTAMSLAISQDPQPISIPLPNGPICFYRLLLEQ